MSGMAEEMTRRMEADGGAGAVPGSGATPPEPTPPAAGPTNTENGDGNGPPDAIPYARFKEVNDRYNSLRGFEQLAEYGYDSDSLSRLAAFEAQYLSDPVGTWKSMADNLDLPQELKDSIEQHLAARGPDSGSAEGEPSSDAQKGLELPPGVQERLDYVDQMREREANTEREAQVKAVASHWDSLDKKDGIETPDLVKFMAIGAMAGSGLQFRTVEELAEAARKTIVDYRSSQLQGAVQRTGQGGLPRTLPGSAPAPGEPIRFADLKDASRAAAEAMKRGEIPGMNG